jgi:NAD(P)H-hydrate epimerase
VRDLDRRAVAEYGLPGIVLMENAGRGCAELLMRLNPTRLPTVVLCGPGNNGGDGFVIARHLDARGWPVTTFLFAPPDDANRHFPKLTPDAATNYRIWEGRNRVRHCDSIPDDPFEFWADVGPTDPKRPSLRLAIRDAGWIVDALFGVGLTRSLGAPYSELVAAVNASGRPVLAVDVPSGLDCDTGSPLGPTIRATHTATFVAPKAGFTDPGSRDWAGRVHVVDIGAPRKLVDEFRYR